MRIHIRPHLNSKMFSLNAAKVCLSYFVRRDRAKTLIWRNKQNPLHGLLNSLSQLSLDQWVDMVLKLRWQMFSPFPRWDNPVHPI